MSRAQRSLAAFVHRYKFGLVLARRGPLRDNGWFESVFTGQSIDRWGHPIPWFTYPAIYFLESRLPRHRELRVAEYGCGNSTLWWSQRAREVVAVEHEVTWMESVRRGAPDNVEIIHRPEYPSDQYAAGFTNRGPFDVIAIDGRNRVACAHAAMELVSERGVIIWDNTDRPQYSPGFEHLKEAGFRRVMFRGTGPIVLSEFETSIFYRSNNILEL
jgi:hypothetical protein